MTISHPRRSSNSNKKGQRDSECPLPFPVPKRLVSQTQPALRSALQAVFLPKFFDATGGIDEFLFAGKERVTIGANFHVNVPNGRARLHHMATGAGNGCSLVCWMDSRLHKLLWVGNFYTITHNPLQLAEGNPTRGEVANVSK